MLRLIPSVSSRSLPRARSKAMPPEPPALKSVSLLVSEPSPGLLTVANDGPIMPEMENCRSAVLRPRPTSWIGRSARAASVPPAEPARIHVGRFCSVPQPRAIRAVQPWR